MEITVAEDKMITGEDWSKIEVSKTDEKDNIIETNNYFPRYFSLFGTKISPFNLGIYQTPSKEGDILRSTQYIGVLPLLPIGSDTEKQNQIHIKILPRFHISPIEMLNEVLLGDDYNDCAISRIGRGECDRWEESKDVEKEYGEQESE